MILEQTLKERLQQGIAFLALALRKTEHLISVGRVGLDEAKRPGIMQA